MLQTAPPKTISEQEWQIRVDLAAALRWAVRLNLHEAVANHFSAAISRDGKQFLLNPKLKHFSRIKASDTVRVDADDPQTLARPDAPDISAWYLHSQLHARLPAARCILHTHMPNMLALACLKDFEFLMTDQNATRFYNRIAYDRHYNGLAIDDQEGLAVPNLCRPARIFSSWKKVGKLLNSGSLNGANSLPIFQSKLCSG